MSLDPDVKPADLAQKALEVSKQTGIPPEKLIEMAKKKVRGAGK